MKPFTLAVMTVYVLFISCQSQINLKEKSFNTKLVVESNSLIKDYSTRIPLKGIYEVKDLSYYSYGVILLKKDSVVFKDESIVYKSTLRLVVDSYDTNNFLGFELTLIDEKISDCFLDYFNATYGKPLKKYEYFDKDYKDQI